MKPRKQRTTEISVTAAKGQLTELVRRAETGEEVILTRHGHAVVRLTPVRPMPDTLTRRALLQTVRKSGRIKATRGVAAARSQDFLYDTGGLPK